MYYVRIMLRPAGLSLTRPLPPADFAARRFAWVIRPPLLAFAIGPPPQVSLTRLPIFPVFPIFAFPTIFVILCTALLP